METGCVFDNHRGIYMGEAVIELAESYGMPREEHRNPEDEFYIDAWIEAEDWLNNNVAEEGCIFITNENGDFMYEEIIWGDEEE